MDLESLMTEASICYDMLGNTYQRREPHNTQTQNLIVILQTWRIW